MVHFEMAIIVTLFFSFMTLTCCQQTNSVSNGASKTSVAIQPKSTLTTIDATVKPSTTPTTGQPDDVDLEEPEAIPCKPGLTIGYMIIRQPNISSIVYVDKVYNVSWEYSNSVSKPPGIVNAYVQLIAPGIRPTWSKQIAENVSTSARQFWWEPKSLVDGKYKLRLVPDGKETFGVSAASLPCFENGEAIPSVSATFQVVSARGNIVEYPERFPANDVVAVSPFDSIVQLLCLLIILFVLNK